MAARVLPVSVPTYQQLEIMKQSEGCGRRSRGIGAATLSPSACQGTHRQALGKRTRTSAPSTPGPAAGQDTGLMPVTQIQSNRLVSPLVSPGSSQGGVCTALVSSSPVSRASQSAIRASPGSGRSARPKTAPTFVTPGTTPIHQRQLGSKSCPSSYRFNYLTVFIFIPHLTVSN